MTGWDAAERHDGHEPPFLLDVDAITGGAFRVGFCEGADHAVITDADGWIAAEIALTEGTCEAIRAEAARLIDLAVESGRWNSHYPKAAAAERKRVITGWCKAATTTHHPRWKSGRRPFRFGGGPGR